MEYGAKFGSNVKCMEPQICSFLAIRCWLSAQYPIIGYINPENMVQIRFSYRENTWTNEESNENIIFV